MQLQIRLFRRAQPFSRLGDDAGPVPVSIADDSELKLNDNDQFEEQRKHPDTWL